MRDAYSKEADKGEDLLAVRDERKTQERRAKGVREKVFGNTAKKIGEVVGIAALSLCLVAGIGAAKDYNVSSNHQVEQENKVVPTEFRVEEASDAEVPLVIPFEEAKEDEIATSSSPDENADIIPVSGESGDAEPILYPVAPSSRPSINMAEDNMAPWMISLMIILVVIMVLYTASSAIRNTYKAPLNRFVAVAIALLLTALSWVLSYIILGPSLLYLAYLVLLGTYFVLRSTKRSDHE